MISMEPPSQHPAAGAVYTMDEAAKRLRMSRRWLQNWLRDHPLDERGRPFYSLLGNKKTFDDDDLYRIRETAREELRRRLQPRGRRRQMVPPTKTSSEILDEVRALARSPRPPTKPGN
jgi:hypothetical protein